MNCKYNINILNFKIKSISFLESNAHKVAVFSTRGYITSRQIITRLGINYYNILQITHLLNLIPIFNLILFSVLKTTF